MLSVRDIAWTAGIIEGEGCFSLSCGWKTLNRNSAVVDVAQKDPEILYRLQRLIGGKLYFRKKDPRPGSRSIDCWHWKCFGTTAVGLSMTVYPFMSQKRRSEIARMLGRWKAGRRHSPYHAGPAARDAEIVRLRHEGMTYAEIAATLNVGYGTVAKVFRENKVAFIGFGHRPKKRALGI